MIHDLRYAIRQLLKSPGFAIIAIITLALGIGANSAIFSAVDAVLRRPLPFSHPDQLVRVYGTSPQLEKAPISPANFLDWKKQNQVLAKIGACTDQTLTLLDGDVPERVPAERVSTDLFELLGVQPSLGRSFRSEDDEYGRNHVVVISHPFWQKHFGGRGDVLGRTLLLNDRPYTIIGVMPPAFSFPDPEIELWTPMAFPPAEKTTRDTNFLSVIGRLREGITLEQASAQMNLLVRQIARQHVRQGMGPAFLGLILGTGAAAVLTRFMRSLLFQVDTIDPVVFLGVALLLAFVAAAACLIPARRASQLNPIVALRME